jgi:hypothetical protein
VLVKLSDRLAGSKLLVRGKNGRSEMQLVSTVTKEVRACTLFSADISTSSQSFTRHKARLS